MRTKFLMLFAGAVFIAGTTPVVGHHAFGAEFDPDAPIRLQGKVVKLEWVNPHAWIHIEVAKPDGTKEVWMIEGGSPNQLIRMGVTKNTVPIGTALVIDAYAAKDGTNKAVGRNFVLPDGSRLFLGGSAPGGTGPGK